MYILGTNEVCDTAKGIQKLVETNSKSIDQLDKNILSKGTMKFLSAEFLHIAITTEFNPNYDGSTWLSIHKDEDSLIRRIGRSPDGIYYDEEMLGKVNTQQSSSKPTDESIILLNNNERFMMFSSVLGSLLAYSFDTIFLSHLNNNNNLISSTNDDKSNNNIINDEELMKRDLHFIEAVSEVLSSVNGLDVSSDIVLNQEMNLIELVDILLKSVIDVDNTIDKNLPILNDERLILDNIIMANNKIAKFRNILSNFDETNNSKMSTKFDQTQFGLIETAALIYYVNRHAKNVPYSAIYSNGFCQLISVLDEGSYYVLYNLIYYLRFFDTFVDRNRNIK